MRERRPIEPPDFLLVFDSLPTPDEAEAIAAEYKRRVKAGDPPVEGERIWVKIDGRENGAWVRKP